MTTMLVAAALALTPSPDAGARAPNAEATAAVLSAFKAYQAALLRKDGPACARLGYAPDSDPWRNCIVNLSTKDDLQRYGPSPGYYAGWGPGYWRGGGYWGPYW